MLNLLNADVCASASALHAQFALREPFRHLVIDDFFAADFLARLRAEFPPFERGNAHNEAGAVGNKSVVEHIRALGPAYTALDELIASQEFRQLIARLTGIDDLLYDPYYFGGGTHENRSGQDLDPHIDFNRHPLEKWHRRLNLIVYLNPQWDEAWGGLLELHSDPYSPDDCVKRIVPLLNRCVIFETTETSWHGFSRITLPAEHAALSRRSIALYFYTRDRPADETAATHATIYVDRPLPARFQSGYRLDGDDVAELQALLDRRQQHTQRVYRDLATSTAELEQARKALSGGVSGRLIFLAQQARKLILRRRNR